MLKMYQGQTSSGSTPEFWDSNWEQNELARVLADVRVVENDPVYELLVDKLRPDGIFLEGGCGQAQWVKYFAERGYRAVGIDFATRTVDKVRRAAPALDVRVGDIHALPFADGEVHSYYSGGVVEHIESGPEPALREARRVMRADGWFLCSVPDESLLRRQLFRSVETDRRDLEPPLAVVRVDRTAQEPARAGMEFFQYAFTEAGFTRLLEDAGFTVESTFGYGLIWGLMELPWFQPLYRGAFASLSRLRDLLRARSAAPTSSEGDVTVGAPSVRGRGHGASDWLRRALVKEDRDTAALGPLIGLLCEYCSNMRMYVARPR
jgi:SAM-dependent methyltransferase